MRFVRFPLSLFVIIALVAVTVPGTGSVSMAANPAEKASVYSALQDKLDEHFQKAEEAFENKDYADAASEIRKGADLLRQEAEQAKAEIKKSLEATRVELERLAGGLEKGTVSSAEDVQRVFFRTHQTLAKYYHSKASESWSKRAFSQAGEYLKGAATQLEKAWKLSGHRIELGTQAVIDAAKDLGDKSVEGAEWVSDEVGKGIVCIEREIGNLEQRWQNSGGDALKIMPIRTRESEMIPHADLTSAITLVAKITIPAVVQIQVTERMEVPNPFLPFEGSPFYRRYFGLPKKMPKKFKEELKGLGTGMIVDPEGHILTNNHVVGGATEIKVFLSSGDEYPAKLMGTDPKTDLGVIKIDAGKPLPYIIFGDSDQVNVGQWVVAIGHPRGLDQTVTQGIISAKHRTGVTDPSGYQDFLQTDAAINPGNSGGPLLTLRGQVIGVNSVIATQSGGFEGLGFAIPSNMAVHVAKALITQGKVERGWLGVSLQELTGALAKSFGLARPKGALIADVMKGGPADKAGFKRGDVVLEYRGEQIEDAAGLRNKVAETPVGVEVKVVVWREKHKQELTVKVGNLEGLRERLTSAVKERLGIVVGPVTADEAASYGLPAPEGVRIHWVDPSGPFGKMGFEEGDLILAIDGRAVSDVDAFLNIIINLPHQQQVALMVLDHSSGQTGYAEVEIE